MRNGTLTEIAERNARIVEAYRAGRTPREIGVTYGLSRQRIEMILATLAPELLPQGRRRLNIIERKERAVALARSGAPLSMIRAHTRLNAHSILSACAAAAVTVRVMGGMQACWSRAYVMLGLGWHYDRIVAETGVSYHSLYLRACELRAEGLPLPKWNTRAGRAEKARQQAQKKG
jgi:hypothetical protein